MTEWNYGVILDAGSSGTRVHVYRWQAPSSLRSSAKLPTLRTKKEWTRKVQPGISSFGDHPNRVGPDHLSDLIAHATTHIPPAQHSSTPIFLLATAGMRLLPTSQRTTLLSRTCAYLQSSSPFLLPSCDHAIQVIPGEAEGLYGWIAANYLLSGFEPTSPAFNHGHPTYGFLEMGGASAQIAFAPNETESKKHADDLKLLRLRRLDGSSAEYRVFVTTWLGYGVQEARRRYLEALQKAGKGEVVDPCLPSGLRTTLAGDVVKDGETQAEVVGKGTWADCLKKTFPLLDKDAPCEDEPCLVHGIHTPAIDFDVNHFVGTSEFWYSTHGVFGAEDDETTADKAYDFHTYQKKVEAFCSQDWRTIKKGLTRKKYGKHVSEQDVIGVCFKASWIINMLHDGIGVPRVGLDPVPDVDGNGTKAVQDAAKKKGFLDPFRAVDKVDDVEVSWTLGRMLLYASSQIEPAASGKDSLAVGYGANIGGSGLPADFQFGGLAIATKGVLSSASTSRRIPGLILFLLIFAFAAFLLCGRERRRAVYTRLASLLGRHDRYGGAPPKSGRKWGFGLDAMPPGHSEDAYYDQLEMGRLDTDVSDSDDDAVAVSSPSRKRASAGLFSDSTGPGPGAERQQSRERLGSGALPAIRTFNVSGSRSRTGSPTRRGSPLVLQSKMNLA